jgi:hypothetical protein
MRSLTPQTPIPRSLTPSPLGRAQPVAMDTERIKREGWQRSHILVIAETDERLDFLERNLIRRIGERLYGDKRGNDRGGKR